MAFWLARSREGQTHDFIQRFDPRFWTVDFPRPVMAAVVTTAPDALRVEGEFHNQNDLAGLIWDSEDRLDHPLLAYDTLRDYSRTTLSFRWRSSGLVPLDAANGPTLTIEGRDEGGAATQWYVRLWNYAEGSGEDAAIRLPFSDLASGWSSESGAPVNPADIDRMFISLAPAGYDPDTAAPLPARVNGWAELSDIRCEGHHAMLRIGDVMVPPHDIGMATAYDDSYNQTPQRLLRTMRGLGYRGRLIHYCGMSHFFRLAESDTKLLADPSGALCTPAELWHQSFFQACKKHALQPIISLSYELFAAHCPEEWQQRTYDGEAALTGWQPPSALLSPAHPQAMQWLKNAAQHFVTLAASEELPLLFQIGEPWWWVTSDGRICLYDDASRTALGGNPPEITDMRAPLDEAQKQLLDDAGALLASSTAALRDAVRSATGEAECEVLLLTFTPTVFDPEMPELYRANLPTGWASPAFDRLQLEDYDWLTAGADALRRDAYHRVNARLSYPVEQQDYLAGFVLDPADAEPFWPRITAGLEEAAARGITQRFVWALPQITRDGFTLFTPAEDHTMQAFDDLTYPLPLGLDASVSPEFSTSVVVTASGHERRNSLWSDARMHFDVGPGIRSENDLRVLIAFFRARRGAARGFRLTDPFDHSSHIHNGLPTMLDQVIAIGDGQIARFPLIKRYGSGDEPQIRRITRPRADTVSVSVDGVQSAFELEEGGWITLAHTPPEGAVIRAGFLFDVPVRFAEDRLDITGVNFTAGEAPSVPLVEIRENVS
ncbi:DUF2460 domain-containing protein [Altericroceibacterium endophyticum]|uniref:TIGR02217 family protein n=1 Tax=Altericroceibacterium endophyticum TaxID=1808508 RepID=A0A6I4T6G3_9SPHN|nr:DUF2460 domain-containing protein [Altericroceibacterium endophyticum]MXO65500.1 TIGR02217 family protein [Altericroceibacterium endophyticum]